MPLMSSVPLCVRVVSVCGIHITSVGCNWVQDWSLGSNLQGNGKLDIYIAIISVLVTIE